MKYDAGAIHWYLIVLTFKVYIHFVQFLNARDKFYHPNYKPRAVTRYKSNINRPKRVILIFTVHVKRLTFPIPCIQDIAQDIVSIRIKF